MALRDDFRSIWHRVLAWLQALLGGGSSTPPTEPPVSGRKKWTFMVYMAGDNNLEGAAIKDLTEMKAVGSTGEINIVAQLDTLSDIGARRYYVRRGTRLAEDVVMRLSELNTGDPAVLEEFILWATGRYPAEHYALVLWNHGSGWKDDDVYAGLASRGYDTTQLTRGQVRSLTSGNSSRALFRSSLEQVAADVALAQRAILFDDTSTDFLDNVEMKEVLDRVTAHLGDKIDVLGCDACLMNMIEVAYQLRESCRFLVGSQEEEPGDGWPYHLILQRLADHPDMSPRLLAATIVEEYSRFYRDAFPNLSVTQSALDLDKLEPLLAAIDDLADALRATLEADWRGGSSLVSLALYEAQKFTDRDYVDLVHLAQLLAQQNPDTAIAAAATRVVDVVKRSGEDSPLVAEGHGGAHMLHVNGICIYLPERNLSPLYDRLEFAKNHRWDDFLRVRLAPRYHATPR